MEINNLKVYVIYCFSLTMFGFYITALGPLIPYLA